MRLRSNKTPGFRKGRLIPGLYRLIVRAADCEPRTVEIELRDGETLEREIVLTSSDPEVRPGDRR